MAKRRNKQPQPAPHERLVVLRVSVGKHLRRRWMLVNVANGERLFRLDDSLRTALEGHHVMTGFKPLQVIKVRGVHTHEKAQELASTALR